MTCKVIFLRNILGWIWPKIKKHRCWKVCFW